MTTPPQLPSKMVERAAEAAADADRLPVRSGMTRYMMVAEAALSAADVPKMLTALRKVRETIKNLADDGDAYDVANLAAIDEALAAVEGMDSNENGGGSEP